MSPSLQQEYSQQMKDHGYGYAFYQPKPSTDIKPGTCGYLDRGCDWTRIVDLGDSDACVRQGLTNPRPLERARLEETNWGPKVSTGVRSKRVAADAKASTASQGLPMEASVAYNFSSDSEFGAILMCSQPVKQDRVYHPARLLDWVKENARAIIALYPDVKDRGFFIVTTTYRVASASISAWRNKAHEVTMGFATDFVGVGEIAPAAQWYQSSNDSGWVTFPESGEDKVVFFGGIYLKPRMVKITGHEFSVKQQDKWQTFRGNIQHSEPVVVDMPGEGPNCIFDLELHGDVSLSSEDVRDSESSDEEYF